MDPGMSTRTKAAAWLARVSIATTVLAAVGLLADPGRAMAAQALTGPEPAPATCTMLVLAATWLPVSALSGPQGRWRLGPRPVAVR